MSLFLAMSCGSSPSGPDSGINFIIQSTTDGGAVASCACTAGVCLSDGGCGECRTSADCVNGRSCEQTHCVVGCLDNSTCRSGVCLASHDCLNCSSDGQCASGGVCGTGVCAAACVTDANCPQGQACCGARCVDPSRDVLDCGGCQPCAAGAFCGRGQCRLAKASNACQHPVVRTLLAGLTIDDQVTRSMAATLVATCVPAVTLAADPGTGILDIVTGEPLRSGELLVVGGGSFRQKVVAWLELENLVPVVVTSVSSDLQYQKRDGTVLVTRPLAAFTETHDVFVIALMTTPRGVVVLNADGYFGTGTKAAAWYFVNQLAPKLAAQTGGWYVVEWQDNPVGGLLGAPDATDTWTPIASGG